MRLSTAPEPYQLVEAELVAFLRQDRQALSLLAEAIARALHLRPGDALGLRRSLVDGPLPGREEARGMAQAALLCCGVAPEWQESLTGHPEVDLARLFDCQFAPSTARAEAHFASASLARAYAEGSAAFQDGVDRVIEPLTGRRYSQYPGRLHAGPLPSRGRRTSGRPRRTTLLTGGDP